VNDNIPILFASSNKLTRFLPMRSNAHDVLIRGPRDLCEEKRHGCKGHPNSYLAFHLFSRLSLLSVRPSIGSGSA